MRQCGGISSSTPVKQSSFSISSLLTSCIIPPIKLGACNDNLQPIEDFNEALSTCSDNSQSREGLILENTIGERVWNDFNFNLNSNANQLLGNTSADQTNGNIYELELNISKACLLSKMKLHNDSDLTVNESILKIMELYLKNKLSKAGLQRTIKTMCDMLPGNHNLPTSAYFILQYIESLAPPVVNESYYYCENCCYYHGTKNEGQCEICKNTTFGHFFFFDLAVLIRFFFENRNLAAIIDSESEKRQNMDPTVMRDLKDGIVYKSINSNRGKYDVNIVLNSDGVRIRRGSKKEMWLVIFTIAEVPIHLRKAFCTVLGVWYDTKKPEMKTFMKPIAEKLKYLEKNGVQWTHPTTQKVMTSCVRLPVAVLDAPARAMVQNILQFNGRYGCNPCEIKTQLSTPIPVRKRIRVYRYVHNPRLRTKERMLEQALSVGDQNHVRGVKGPSVLSTIPSVDISKCIVPEYMHSVLIGVAKQLLEIWTIQPGNWSLKNRIVQIDDFLDSFKHPDFVHRSTRQLKSLKYWKASDFYYFMFFEALPALTGHLPDLYLQHFTLLIKGIFSLLKSSLTDEEIDEAEVLLRLFVVDFGKLYGDRALTHNVHQISHLALCVRRYGPLFCFSAFPYEDLNGMVAKSSHGTNLVDVEIVKNIKICQGIQMLQNIVRGHHGLNVDCNSFSEGELLGTEVCKILSAEEIDVLADDHPKKFSRAKLGYDVYTSKCYKTLNKSSNFYIMWTDESITKYGSIEYFAQSKFGNFVFIKLFTVDHTQVFYHRDTLKCISHFVPVIESNNNIAVKLSDIASTIVKVGKINSYIYFRPNLYRFVM